MNVGSDTEILPAFAGPKPALRDAAPKTLGSLFNVNLKPLQTILAALLLAFSNANAEQLPAPARALSASPSGDRAVASMALGGFALINAADARVVLIRKDVATLNALWLNEELCLLAGRFSELIVVRFPKTGGAEIQNRFPCEGIPNHLSRTGTELRVAAGGDGLLLYHWDNPAQPPRITARYPFVDFTRQCAPGPKGILLLADNRDTGVQIIGQLDRHRLRREAKMQAGRVECVAAQGDLVAVGSRENGTLLLNIAQPQRPRPVGKILLPGIATAEQVRELHFTAPGHLLICEGAAGAVLVNLQQQGQNMSTSTIWRQPRSEGGAACAAVLGPKQIIVATEAGRLRRYTLP